MIERENIYAVVVWYHPTAAMRANIDSYIGHVRHVVIVDNSEENNEALTHDLPANCTYLPMGKNKGIASALNKGCRAAFQQGAQWVLTMDQDSCWEEEQLKTYFRLANAYPAIGQTGVFSPRQDYISHFREYEQVYEEKIAVMTSGCLLSREGFAATGGFRDELFIDEVDNEYCMHIRRKGMKVVVINHAFLAHELGELRTIRIMGIWKKEYIDHAPFRFYYMTRNILFLNYLYPEYRRFNTKRLHKMLKRIVLYDRQHKFAALRACWRGRCDARKMIVEEKKHHRSEEKGLQVGA